MSMLKIWGRNKLLWLCLAPKESYNVACLYKSIGNLETMEKIQVSVQNVISVLLKYLSEVNFTCSVKKVYN